MNESPPLHDPTPHEKRADIRAEYDAEFEPDAGAEAAAQTADVQAQLAKIESADAGGLASLLGPSPRTIIQRIELEFRRKIRDMEREVAEMMEREVALKQSNRTSTEHSHKLAEERDYWLNLKDPERVNSALREDAAKSKTLYQGAVKRCFELEADLMELKGKLEDLQEKRAKPRRAVRTRSSGKTKAKKTSKKAPAERGRR